jgi:hypothetical protein
MTSWISEYQSALDARDSREKANSVYIEACKTNQHLKQDATSTHPYRNPPTSPNHPV